MGGVKIDLPWITCDRGRYYVRRRGWPRKIRLHASPGTDAFLMEYHTAVAALARPAPTVPTATGTLAWLVERYYESAEFKQLSEHTRYTRRRVMTIFCAEHGDKPFARAEPAHLRSIRDKMSAKPEAANDWLKALRQVFAWAVAAGHLERNPAALVPYLRSNNPDGFHTWTRAEVERFEARWPIGTKPRLALALLLYTGVRRSDLVKLGRQMIRDGWLEWTEAKGAARKPKHRAIPILPALQAVIDATPSSNMTFIVTDAGHPYTLDGFGHWFRRAAIAAGLELCTAHGLRKAGATIAAENGATEQQLMAIYGWTTGAQAALYTRRANKRRMAGDAMCLIDLNETQKRPVSD